MKKILNSLIQNKKVERGQALILIAIAFLVLLGFVGLTTDVGQLFIYMGHLRQGLDAASLAASGQYREGRGISEITSAASEAMELNGIATDTYTVTVDTCETLPGDPQLCTTPRRKLVRVSGQLNVPTIFLHLVGIGTIPIHATSIGEAASLDVVLVIDMSDSMTFDAPQFDPNVHDPSKCAGLIAGTDPINADNMFCLRDPSICNALDPSGTDGFPGECQPFEEVKEAASAFVTRILDKPPEQEQDRLAIVAFANGWSDDLGMGTHVLSGGWISNKVDAQTIIKNLTVFEPKTDSGATPGYCFDPRNDGAGSQLTSYGPCLFYVPENYPPDNIVPPENSFYSGYLDCISCWDIGGGIQDWSYQATTNIGGGLLLAGNMFALQPREEALWVVVLLTDGMANATFREEDDNILDFATYPVGYCPQASMDPANLPLCQDKKVSTRHRSGNAQYDADDYARDMADFVGCLSISDPTQNYCRDASGNVYQGQGAVIFTIGLGDEVLNNINEVNGKPYGADLLRYIARVGYAGDPRPENDPCKGKYDTINEYKEWCGNYYFSPSGPQLTRIFEDIASRIFTRLVH